MAQEYRSFYKASSFSSSGRLGPVLATNTWFIYLKENLEIF